MLGVSPGVAIGCGLGIEQRLIDHGVPQPERLQRMVRGLYGVGAPRLVGRRRFGLAGLVGAGVMGGGYKRAGAIHQHDGRRRCAQSGGSIRHPAGMVEQRGRIVHTLPGIVLPQRRQHLRGGLASIALLQRGAGDLPRRQHLERESRSILRVRGSGRVDQIVERGAVTVDIQEVTPASSHPASSWVRPKYAAIVSARAADCAARITPSPNRAGQETAASNQESRALRAASYRIGSGSGERIVSSASMAVYRACSHALGSYSDSARPWMRGIVQAPAVRVSASTAAAEAQRRICVKTR